MNARKKVPSQTTQGNTVINNRPRSRCFAVCNVPKFELLQVFVESVMQTAVQQSARSLLHLFADVRPEKNRAAADGDGLLIIGKVRMSAICTIVAESLEIAADNRKTVRLAVDAGHMQHWFAEALGLAVEHGDASRFRLENLVETLERRRGSATLF